MEKGPEGRAAIRRGDLGSPVARRLIAALNDELAPIYPEAGANHFRLDVEEVEPGRGAFFLAYLGDEPVGCGAVRCLDEETAEVKRMYVVPAHRGRGVGRAILGEIEAEARRLGVARLVLETGGRQPEVLALYASAGFAQIPRFGEYLASPLSVCMGKSLSRPSVRRT
ncbi:MAG: GNAT family N-acetyltransferase [Acidobacteriia bacterium]|nr:GNAT family N-acetyltransferase [Terriglobia bacterium]